MDEPNQPSQPSVPPSPLNKRSASPVRWIVWLCLLAAIVYSADAVRRTLQASEQTKQTDADVVQSAGLVTPVTKGLAPGFTDSQGRLLADPPSDASQLSDPQTIVFAHLPPSDKDSETAADVSWPQFEAHLSAVTGRKVTDMTFDNSPEQLAMIKQGQITLVSMHPADAPFLVNNFGYQPVAVLGDQNAASGNHLDIMVPAKSTITTLDELRDHTLTCTAPSSITGYRAAIALLMELNGLRPNVDYFINWSLKQKDSIQGIVSGQYEAAAISDDKLQSMLKNGDVTDSSYRIIYRSDTIPRTTIGYFNNLNPDLAAKVRDAVQSFAPDASSADTAVRFISVDYKKDFQLVREIDDRFDPRLDAKTKHASAAPDQPDNSAATEPADVMP
jgi:phosphonate transport system substrate-binding protein